MYMYFIILTGFVQVAVTYLVIRQLSKHAPPCTNGRSMYLYTCWKWNRILVMCSEHPLCLLSTKNQHAFLHGTIPEKYNPGGGPHPRQREVQSILCPYLQTSNRVHRVTRVSPPCFVFLWCISQTLNTKFILIEHNTGYITFAFWGFSN